MGEKRTLNEGGARAWMVPALRLAEFVLGAVFLLAAGLKLADANLFVAQIFQYQVFTSTTLLGLTAVVTLLLETALGVLMVLGIRMNGLVPAATFLMLLFFTGLIAYAWPDDCGCFGAVKMGPGVSITKNVVMMVVAAAVLLWGRKEDGWPRGATVPRIGVALLAGLAAAAYAYPQVFQQSTKGTPQTAATAPAQPAASQQDNPASPAPAQTPSPPAAAAATPAGPYAGYVVESDFGERFDLSSGDYLVASLSMTCEHCMESVPTLNELTLDPSLPRLVALALEQSPGDRDEFIATTQPMFPIHSIGNNFLEFSKLIADSPPRLALVRNGSAVITWDKELPTAAEITAGVTGALAGLPSE
jgi:hypothetical protein